MQISLLQVAKLLTAGSTAIVLSSALVAQDEPGTATPVVLGANGTFNNNTATPSTLPGPFTCGLGGTGILNDVWFVYTSTGAGILTVSTCSPAATTPWIADTVIEIWDGALTTQLGCNDDGGACGFYSQLAAPVSAGAYYIRVAGYSGATGDFDLDLSLTLPQVNDECSGALPIVAGVNGPYDNLTASTSFAFPAPCEAGAAGGNDVWFSYLATSSGPVTIDTCGSALDSIMEVFYGTCNGLQSIVCNDDTCNFQSQVTFQSLPCVTYYVRVGGWNGNTGVFSLNVTPTPGTGTFGTFAPSNCANGRVLTLTGDPNIGGTVTATMTGYDGLAFVTWGFGTTSQPLAPSCTCDFLDLATQWVFTDTLSLTIPCTPAWIGLQVKAQGADANAVANPACTSFGNLAATDIQVLTIGS